MSSKPLKWTRQEDERLIKGVQKYGNSWAQVQSEYCQGRTRNAIVKRWHGKLKELNGDLSKMHYSEDDEQSNNKNQSKKQLPPQDTNSLKEQQQEPKIIENYKYTRQWSTNNDKQLKSMVLKKKIFNWETLASQFNTTTQQVIKRWQNKIYPSLKVTTKITRAVKWSQEEDALLMSANKYFDSNWDEVLQFLPTRTYWSVQGRWRRLSRLEVSQPSKQQGEESQEGDAESSQQQLNKYQYRKYVIHLIATKTAQQQQTT